MKVKERVEALEAGYHQLMSALKEKVDSKEVDPEKRKAAMALYRLAQEDSRKIWDELLELKGLVLVTQEEADEIALNKSSNKTAGLSPEQRMK